MAEYIEREAFKRKLIDEKSFFPTIVARALEEMPTADVVPKSEVDKWKQINEQLHKEMSERMVEELKIERRLVAREIFEEIDNLSVNTVDDWGNSVQIISEIDYAELKKKYTEG